LSLHEEAHPMRSSPIALAILAGLALWPAAGSAQTSLTAGRRLAAQQCGVCHAVDQGDQSPNPKSPRFRDLGARYPYDGLRDALRQGMMVGHARMPVLRLSPVEIDDLIAYVKTLQKPLAAASSGRDRPL
jgi:mono/diheme cytochrome c family protein